jgi:hypothetical protein
MDKRIEPRPGAARYTPFRLHCGRGGLQLMPHRTWENCLMYLRLSTLAAFALLSCPAFAQPPAAPSKPALPATAEKPADAPTAPAKGDEIAPAPGGPHVEVQFGDGSIVKLTLLDPKLDITTRYGKLSVPLNEVRRIELGVRYPEGSLQKIQDAIAKLGDGDYKKREAASTELLAFRELAYPHVRRAAVTANNPEALKRAKALLEELRSRLPEDKLALKDYDTVTTMDFPIAGQIGAAIFKARSPLLGDVDVKLVQVRSIRWMGATNEASLTMDASKYSGVPGETWLDTGIDLNGEKISINASGTIDVMPNNPGQFMAGPGGMAQDVGMRRGGVMVGQPGALVGRIGNNGQPFLVGAQYNETPRTEGRLFLRLEPSPWRVAMQGTFTIKIVSGK